MKYILTPVFCTIVAFAFAWAAPLSSQERTLTMDQMIRRLGGDPDKGRADAAKRALLQPTPEEEENNRRAMEMAASLTDEIIASIPSSDPRLLALYTNRIGMGTGSSKGHPWLLVVDRDIRRRPDAKALFQTIFQKTNRLGRRFYVMRWLAANADVPWGNDIMEEAIKSYRADPSKWDSGEAAILCRLVVVRGLEAHLEFLAELDAKGIGDGGTAWTIRRRLKQTGEPQTAKASAMIVAPMSALPHQTNPSALPLAGSNQIYWMAGGLLVLVAAGLWLWSRMQKS